MRAAALIFLSFLFLLLPGRPLASADTMKDFAPKAQMFNAGSTSSVKSATGVSTENKHLVVVEEDEDDVVISRKYVLLARYFLTLVCAFTLSYFCWYIRRYNLLAHLSYYFDHTYLKNRTLRL
jgi:hypothetical protein